MTDTRGKTETLLTIQDVAARLQVAERTIREWRRLGKIVQPIAFGHFVRWRASDLDRWIADGCPESSAQ